MSGFPVWRKPSYQLRGELEDYLWQLPPVFHEGFWWSEDDDSGYDGNAVEHRKLIAMPAVCLFKRLWQSYDDIGGWGNYVAHPSAVFNCEHLVSAEVRDEMRVIWARIVLSLRWGLWIHEIAEWQDVLSMRDTERSDPREAYDLMAHIRARHHPKTHEPLRWMWEDAPAEVDRIIRTEKAWLRREAALLARVRF